MTSQDKTNLSSEMKICFSFFKKVVIQFQLNLKMWVGTSRKLCVLTYYMCDCVDVFTVLFIFFYCLLCLNMYLQCMCPHTTYLQSVKCIYMNKLGFQHPVLSKFPFLFFLQCINSLILSTLTCTLCELMRDWILIL